MNKITRFVKVALFSSALALLVVGSVRASEEAGGSCQPPKDTLCGSCIAGWCPYGNYTPGAN